MRQTASDLRRRRLRWNFALLLALPLVAGQSAPPPSAAQTQPSAAPAATQPGATSQPSLSRFADDIARFVEWDRRNSFPPDAILFVGSSTIRMWPTRELFPQWPTINRGFGGSQIVEVNHYFDQVVAPYKAKVIVFYAGDNDVTAGTTPEAVRDDFAAFVRQVRQTQPETSIVFLSIKPSMARWKHWPQMQAANALVKRLCAAEPHLVFVELGASLLGPDGQPRPEFYRDDKLHLSPEGYALWSRELTPILAPLMR